AAPEPQQVPRPAPPTAAPAPSRTQPVTPPAARPAPPSRPAQAERQQTASSPTRNSIPPCRWPGFSGAHLPGGAHVQVEVMNNGQVCGHRWWIDTGRTVPLNALWVEQAPSHGSIQIDGNSFRYVATPGYVGPDSF